MYVVDELECTLHPHLALRIIELFKNPETNPKRARLLFSTHDSMFMHPQILQGDQIWLFTRDENGDTELNPLAIYEDFNPVNAQLDYMRGVYSRVPGIEG
ncbi:MAG: AAA family ATPase [Vampirovibrionales bacterium]